MHKLQTQLTVAHTVAPYRLHHVAEFMFYRFASRQVENRLSIGTQHTTTVILKFAKTFSLKDKLLGISFDRADSLIVHGFLVYVIFERTFIYIFRVNHEHTTLGTLT